MVVAALFVLVYRTRWGHALQAVAEDRQVAALVGISPDRVNAQVWMLGSAAVGLAGALLTTFFYVFPSVGTVFGCSRSWRSAWAASVRCRAPSSPGS